MSADLTYPTAVQTLTNKADVVDIKQTVTTASLRQFIAGFLNYHPLWIQGLYGVRAAFVKVLGMSQKGMPRAPRLTPETVPMRVAQKAGFFAIEAAEENKYWVAGITDVHLTAHLAIVCEPLSDSRNRISVITLVDYHDWRGPFYYNGIRPFHYVVVWSMMRAGANATLHHGDKTV